MISGNYYKVNWLNYGFIVETVIVKVNRILPEDEGKARASAVAVMGLYEGHLIQFDESQIIEKFGHVDDFREQFPEYFI